MLCTAVGKINIKNDINSLIMQSQHYAKHGPSSDSLHYKQPMCQTLTLFHFIFKIVLIKAKLNCVSF